MDKVDILCKAIMKMKVEDLHPILTENTLVQSYSLISGEGDDNVYVNNNDNPFKISEYHFHKEDDITTVKSITTTNNTVSYKKVYKGNDMIHFSMSDDYIIHDITYPGEFAKYITLNGTGADEPLSVLQYMTTNSLAHGNERTNYIYLNVKPEDRKNHEPDSVESVCIDKFSSYSRREISYNPVVEIDEWLSTMKDRTEFISNDKSIRAINYYGDCISMDIVTFDKEFPVYDAKMTLNNLQMVEGLLIANVLFGEITLITDSIVNIYEVSDAILVVGEDGKISITIKKKKGGRKNE